MIPKPGRIVARLGLTVSKPLSESQMRAVCNQFAIFNNVPFLGPYLKRVQELLGPGRVGKIDERRYCSYDDVIPKPDARTWAWFHYRYNLTPDDEEVLKSELQLVKQLPWSLNSHVLRCMADVDYY